MRGTNKAMNIILGEVFAIYAGMRASKDAAGGRNCVGVCPR